MDNLLSDIKFCELRLQVPEALPDISTMNVGYETPLQLHFNTSTPARLLGKIEGEITELQKNGDQ